MTNSHHQTSQASQQSAAAQQAGISAEKMFSSHIIDEQGHETLITDSLIQQACDELEKHWVYPASKEQSSRIN